MRLGLELDTPGALEVSILSGHELTAADPNGLRTMKVRVGHHRADALPASTPSPTGTRPSRCAATSATVDQELLLKVRDHDVGAIRDDRLGEFRIMRLELDELRASARRPLEFHHAKLDGEGAGYGYISFELVEAARRLDPTFNVDSTNSSAEAAASSRAPRRISAA